MFDAQEEERGRVARELHDGISQILVGVRYALETARRRLAAGDARAEDTLDRGAAHLSTAIQEVRRISRDLRPGALDDLGLGPALKALSEDFGRRTGIVTEFDTVVFRNRLDDEAKIALYRVAQEALTNIERHSGATRVHIDLRGHASGGTLRITDNGCGIDASRAGAGGGLGPAQHAGTRRADRRAARASAPRPRAPRSRRRCRSPTFSRRRASPRPAPETKRATRMTHAPTRVVIVDDHPMVTEGIQSILEGYDDIEVIAALACGQAIIDRVGDLAPDVVLLDLNMPGIGGLSTTEIVLERRPGTRILILSMHDSPEYIASALSHGASGYVLKDVPVDEIKRAIDAVMAGQRYLCTGAQGSLAPFTAPEREQLTNREQTILLLLAMSAVPARRPEC